MVVVVVVTPNFNDPLEDNLLARAASSVLHGPLETSLGAKGRGAASCAATASAWSGSARVCA